jgi:chromosome segregation ATPase
VTSSLARHRRADSDRRQDAVRQALAQMAKAGEPVTASSVARRAGVHRSLIYRHPGLRAVIETAASTRPAPAQRTDHVSTASLKATVSNERERNRRLTQRITQLEQRLSEALGRETFRDTGLDRIDQTTALETRITDLDQDNAELRRKLSDITAELEAAQHVNQQLTRQLNRLRHGSHT